MGLSLNYLAFSAEHDVLTSASVFWRHQKIANGIKAEENGKKMKGNILLVPELGEMVL